MDIPDRDYDFRMDRIVNSLAFKILNIIDEYIRECLSILKINEVL
jgi:hypothetical protein